MGPPFAGMSRRLTLRYRQQLDPGLRRDDPFNQQGRLRLPRHALLHYSWASLSGPGIATMSSPPPAQQHPATYATAIQHALGLLESGKLGEAEHLCRSILQGKPDDFNALHILGVCANARRAFPEAAVLLGRALATSPNSYEVLVRRGIALQALQRFEEAMQHYDRALAVKPDAADAHCNRGNALQAMGKSREAIENYDKAIALAPRLADAYSNRAVALMALNRHQEAIDDCGKAIAIRPDFAEAYSNRAYALQELGLHQQAITDCDRATAIKPSYAEANWIKSQSMLSAGLSEAGWKLWEQRLQTKKYGVLRDFGLPLLGEMAPNSRKLLIQWEQRFGDVIQMLRFVPHLESIAGRCYWQIQEPLSELFVRSFPSARQVAISECPADAEFRVPITSLPLVTRTFSEAAIPAPVPYLVPDTQRVARSKHELDSSPVMPTVGIVWRGNPEPPNRSVPIEHLQQLFAMSGVRFVSLQREQTAAESRVLERFPQTLSLGDTLTSFDDTAAVIGAVDLVITIDTAIAHLAGALGATTWVLLKAGADWRWLLDRGDSPWYPTARLFRQPRLGDWDTVIARVRAKLAERYGTPA